MDQDIKDTDDLRRQLKDDWTSLWCHKYDDPIVAEGVSITDFPKLFVDRGEIVYATRDYKPISFKSVLEKHLGSEIANRVSIDPNVGGWKKFSKTNFPAKKSKRERPKIKVDLDQQQRKGGQGWLNKNRIARKKRSNMYI